MNATNICKFQGRIIRKSEPQATESGASVINALVAVESVAINGAGDQYNRTDFAQIVFFDDLALEVERLLRNTAVIIEARMQTRSYRTQAGEKRYVTEFVALNVDRLA